MPKRPSHAATRLAAPRPRSPRKRRPRATFRRTVVSASSGSWKTLAMRRRTASAARGATAAPRKRTSPADGGFEQAEDAQERRLARAVRADEGEDLARRHRERGHVEHGAAAVRHADSRRSSSTGARHDGQHVDGAAMHGELPVALARDVEDLVDHARHLDLQIVVALGRRAGLVQAEIERPRHAEVRLAARRAPPSGSCGGRRRRGPRSFLMSRTYSGRMKNASCAPGSGR